MDILDVAEAIGSIVERVKTPTIDWKQRALEAEEGEAMANESEAKSNKLLEAITAKIRNLNSVISDAITLAGGKPGTIHLFDAISNLSLERDRLRDELDAARKRIGQAEANAVALATELRAEKHRAERLTARVREIADDVLALQPADADPMALCLDIAAAYHKTREKPVDAPACLVTRAVQLGSDLRVEERAAPTQMWDVLVDSGDGMRRHRFVSPSEVADAVRGLLGDVAASQNAKKAISPEVKP